VRSTKSRHYLERRGSEEVELLMRRCKGCPGLKRIVRGLRGGVKDGGRNGQRECTLARSVEFGWSGIGEGEVGGALWVSDVPGREDQDETHLHSTMHTLPLLFLLWEKSGEMRERRGRRGRGEGEKDEDRELEGLLVDTESFSSTHTASQTSRESE
jgi:hypothetical protein